MAQISQINIYTDGGSRGNPGLAGAGVFATGLVGSSEIKLAQLALFLGQKTNNEAEYLGFLAALKWLKQFLDKAEAQTQDKQQLVKATTVSVNFFLDSKLVVEQVNKNWKIKEPRLAKLAKQCWQELEQISQQNCVVKLTHVVREKNKTADSLANLAMDLAIEK